MADVCMAALGLATSSSSSCLVWQGKCPPAAIVPRKGWGTAGLGAERLLVCTRGQRETHGAGWRCFLTPALKSCCGASHFQADPQHPKGAPLSASVLSLAAVPSTRAVSALEPGQQLRVEAVPSSSLLDLRQKSY